jgi:hypothetical protein
MKNRTLNPDVKSYSYKKDAPLCHEEKKVGRGRKPEGATVFSL